MDINILTVFILAIFVGFEIITKIPPTLHTPLMSGSNAISGIAIVGAIIGFGVLYGGVEAVHWPKVWQIVSSWVISPLLSNLYLNEVERMLEKAKEVTRQGRRERIE